ncbi:hypothetical protein [Nocardia wallacei]|nr:hypothetical protein [Nocardia wallacei]
MLELMQVGFYADIKTHRLGVNSFHGRVSLIPISRASQLAVAKS